MVLGVSRLRRPFSAARRVVGRDAGEARDLADGDARGGEAPQVLPRLVGGEEQRPRVDPAPAVGALLGGRRRPALAAAAAAVGVGARRAVLRGGHSSTSKGSALGCPWRSRKAAASMPGGSSPAASRGLAGSLPRRSISSEAWAVVSCDEALAAEVAAGAGGELLAADAGLPCDGVDLGDLLLGRRPAGGLRLSGPRGPAGAGAVVVARAREVQRREQRVAARVGDRAAVGLRGRLGGRRQPERPVVDELAGAVEEARLHADLLGPADDLLGQGEPVGGERRAHVREHVGEVCVAVGVGAAGLGLDLGGPASAAGWSPRRRRRRAPRRSR